jgi:hypothetical protein
MWTLRVNDDRLDRPKDDVMHGQRAAVLTSSLGQKVDLNAEPCISISRAILGNRVLQCGRCVNEMPLWILFTNTDP